MLMILVSVKCPPSSKVFMKSLMRGRRMNKARSPHRMTRLIRRTGSLSKLRKRSLGLSSTEEAGIFNPLKVKRGIP
jgi:hypothetical protein